AGRVRDAVDGQDARLDPHGLAVLVEHLAAVRRPGDRAVGGLLLGRQRLLDLLVDPGTVEDAVVPAAVGLDVAGDRRGPAAGLLQGDDAGPDREDLVDDQWLATLPRATRARIGADVVAQHRVGRVRRGRQIGGGDRRDAGDASRSVAGARAVEGADLEPVGRAASELAND